MPAPLVPPSRRLPGADVDQDDVRAHALEPVEEVDEVSIKILVLDDYAEG